MGSSQSTNAGGPDALQLAIANMQRSREGPTGGGRRGYFGGAPAAEADPAKELREYEASYSAKTKEEFIRRLGRAMARSQLVSVNPDGDLDAIVKALIASLPNPETNKKTFAEDAKKQAEVCRVIAGVLNDEFTPGASKPSEQLIDVSLSPAAICTAVWEWVRSFTAGVNTEFLAVHASVRNVMKSLAVLREVMEEAYRKIRAAAARGADAESAAELDSFTEVYERAQAERTRQEEMLKNLLNIRLVPAMKELELAMRDESSQSALIKRLGLTAGTKGFSNSLAIAISGLGSAANIANRVHRALKAVGVDVRDYLNSKSFAEFQRMLDTRIESGAVPAADLAKFLAAASALRTNFDARADEAVKAALEAAPKSGGADAEDAAKSTVDKRVAKTRMEKKLIIHDFVARMARHYDELLAAVKALGPELGTKIPITDKTDSLRDALIRLRDMRESRIELALVGYYADAGARERKERFLSGLRLASATCTDLMDLEAFRGASTLLAGLKASIDGLEKTVDYFSDVLTKKFGGADEDGAIGGADGDLTDAELLPEIARSSLSLNEAVNEFVYFYYVARIRANLTQASKEVDAFGEKYVSLLGDAVAANMIRIRNERIKVETMLNDRGTSGSPAATAFPAGADANYAAAKEFVSREYAVKEQLYRALQAVDLYLKEFAAGVARDPDAIRDFKKMLDGTEVIARWFNEDTGDNLWRAFEFMDSVDAAGAKAEATVGAAARDAAGEHYYVKVAAAITANRDAATVGVPVMGVGAKAGSDAQKSIGSALEMFQALKNLVNAFARIGSQFGGADIRAKVFMSPMQIYKALMDYLRLSALSINTRAGEAPLNIPAKFTRMTAAGAAETFNIANAVEPYQVYFSSVQAGLVGNFAREDRYFVIIIKSMAAKILTTLGVFDLFERRTPLYEMTATRTIIGGAGGYDDEVPEVLEGAAELYFRLPRLVEFYRRFLRGDASGATMKVAMLPEVEGIFAGLIRLIFLRMSNPSSGDYSDSELRDVVREVNAIHAHFRERDGERATHAAINALVAEVNRRFGIVKTEDMKKFLDMLRRTGASDSVMNYNNTNFAILPGEDELDTDRRAPSDRFNLAAGAVSGTDAIAAELAGRVQLDDNVTDATSRRMMLRDFRLRLEKEFAGFSAETMGTSFTLLISQAVAEILRAPSREAKFAVAAKLIQGTGSVALDSSKALMFHETAVVALNTVSAIHTLVREFETRMTLLNADRLRGEVMDALLRSKLAGAAAAPADRAALVALSDKLVPTYLLDTGDNLRQRVGFAANATAGGVYAEIDREWANLVDLGGKTPSALLASETDVASLTVPQKRTFRALAFFARVLVNYELMMRDYIENLFDMSGSSLAEVRFPAGGTAVQISFTKLRGLAESLLADAKFFVDTFRAHISREVLERFEGSGQAGSIFWLEKNFVDVHLRGVSETPEDQARTLEGISRRAAAAFASLTRDTQVAIDAAMAADIVNSRAVATYADPAANNAASRVETYGAILSDLVFYDATAANSGQPTIAGIAATDASYALGALVAAPAGATPITGRQSLYRSTGLTGYRSLMFAFNQLLAGYLAVGTDPAGARKVYLPLVNAYANGVAARAVASPSGNTQPDVVTAGAAAAMGFRGDPATGAVLLESLACVLNHLVKDVNPTTQVSVHLTTTLTDVPLYVKEGMRANLHSFVHLFELIGQKGEFIKQLVQKTAIDCRRPSQLLASGAAAGDKSVGTGALTSQDGLRPLSEEMSSEDMKVRLAEIIDSIDTGAYTLASSATEVLKELGDTPIYFQTQEGSIETYKQRYGKAPLMPLSTALYFLSDLTPGAGALPDDPKLFPRVSLGEPAFKIQYGVRGLLAGSMPVELDRCPGARALLDAYNGVTAKREQIESTRYLGFARGVVSALRWIVDARNYKSVLSTTPRVFSYGSLASGAGNGIRLGADGNAAYAIGKSEQAIVTQIESSNQEEEIGKLTALVGGRSQRGSGEDARKREQILSLLEMNIVPINVHALMRDVPLANSYNFEFTFEQMAAAFYGEDASAITSGSLTDAQTVRSRQLFLRLLADPYLDLHANGSTAAEFVAGVHMYGSDVVEQGTGGFVHRIFRGDNDLGLGRPKFLSDQLFNKALFGSTYLGPTNYDEAGPGIGSGIVRGRDDVDATRGRAAPLVVRRGGTSTLFYLGSQPDAAAGAGPETTIKRVRVDSRANGENTRQLEAIGRARFDTRLVRNLFFIVNVLRLVRAKLSRELTQSRNVIVSSHAAVAAGVTEYGSDAFGPNEVYGSSLLNGQRRFNDLDTY